MSPTECVPERDCTLFLHRLVHLLTPLSSAQDEMRAPAGWRVSISAPTRSWLLPDSMNSNIKAWPPTSPPIKPRARQLAATPILNSFPPQQREAKKYMSCVLVAQINQNVRAAYFILPHVYNPSTDRQENNSELQRISVRSYTETYFFEHQSFSSHSLIWKSTGLLYLQQQIATFSEEKWERCLHVHKPTPWG